MKYLMLFVNLVLLNISCTHKLSPDAGWNENPWIVAELNGTVVEQGNSHKNAFISFEPAAKRFSGNGGCNHLAGNYSISNNTIRFTEVISTKMSCYDIEFENTFLAALNNIDHYEIKDKQLLLKKGGQLMMVLRTK